MTGYDIYKKACARVGVSGAADEIIADSRLLARALEFVNQIALDLKMNEINNLSDEIAGDSVKTEALCCGVAMLISLSCGQAEKNQIYANIYNSKRAAVLAHSSFIEDKLPTAEDGD